MEFEGKRIGHLGSPRIYLDHNATAPLLPEARAAMEAAFDCAGNPSSIHAEGRAARALIERARRDVGRLVSASPDDVIFTSGATEALNMILTPEVFSPSGPAEILLMGAGEHAAVLEGHRFAPAQTGIVALDRDGRLDLGALRAMLERHAGRRLVLALQAANNETGVIQPVAAAAALVHAQGGMVVCDAVQAAGKIACDVKDFAVDALVVSGHKFGGPKGTGALIFSAPGHHLRRGVVRGGGQERGLRAGTENVSGIAGLGAAAAVAARTWPDLSLRLEAWRGRLEAAIRRVAPEAVIFGEHAARLPNTINFAIPGIEAQTLLMNLDLCGIALSSGSACSSGKVKPSHVLGAMGVPDALSRSALRLSLGWTTVEANIAGFETALSHVLSRLHPRVLCDAF